MLIFFLETFYSFLLGVYNILVFLVNKMVLLFCWFFFFFNVLSNYLSYCGGCFFRFDFIIVTNVWVLRAYLYWGASYNFLINLVEERNFGIIFFIFLVELLRKVIQFFTIILRFLVNVVFGELIKLLLIYNNFGVFFRLLGVLEGFILFVQALIFYYMLIYYCGE